MKKEGGVEGVSRKRGGGEQERGGRGSRKGGRVEVEE